MVVPDELRQIPGQRGLAEIGLPNDARAREKTAIGIIDAFHANNYMLSPVDFETRQQKLNEAGV